jgi:hypothetical protein
MKKISTAAAQKIGKVEGQRLTVGLDLGDRSSWYCVLDEAGEVLLEQQVATTAKAMKEVFGRMPRSRIALETGMHSPKAGQCQERFCFVLTLPERAASAAILPSALLSERLVARCQLGVLVSLEAFSISHDASLLVLAVSYLGRVRQ